MDSEKPRRVSNGLFSASVRTSARTQMVDITHVVSHAIAESRIAFGTCLVFVPHTTAAVTINENADPDVQRDICMEIDRIIPWVDGYAHYEGNSAAHLKSTLTGCSESIIVDNGRLLLGAWQGIYLTEYDGPRTRTVYIKVVEG